MTPVKTYLIDDDDLGIYLTEHLLRAEGFSNTICTFQSATEALDTLLKEKDSGAPTVVFLDLNMPLMNGWQFLDALAPYQPELLGRWHIYILTSSLALSDLEKSKEYDLVSGLIHKPIDTEEIRAIQSELAGNTTGGE
jgi:CheY-like chemotaxis protein